MLLIMDRISFNTLATIKLPKTERQTQRKSNFTLLVWRTPLTYIHRGLDTNIRHIWITKIKNKNNIKEV